MSDFQGIQTRLDYAQAHGKTPQLFIDYYSQDVLFLLGLLEDCTRNADAINELSEDEALQALLKRYQPNGPILTREELSQAFSQLVSTDPDA